MRHWLVYLLLLATLPLQAQQNVEFHGRSENAVGKRIELVGYEDMLTCREVLLDDCVVDDTGGFTLGCYANYPRLVFLQVENYSQSFYIVPGQRYDIFIPQFDWAMDETHNVFLDPVALPLLFLNVDSSDLNLKIKLFEELVDTFVVHNTLRMDFKMKPDRKVMDELERQVDELVAGLTKRWGEDVFFERYVRFHLAEMRLAMRSDSRKRLFDRFVGDDPIRYYDESYMSFFLALFDHSLSGGTRKISQYRLHEWIMTGDMERYLDSIGLDPLLRNEQVRELVMLQALKESWFDPRYDRVAVKRMVLRLASDSKFPEHRRLAARLAQTLNATALLADAKDDSPVSLADFSLPDVEKNPVSLDSWRGKWVYLAFVRVNDPNSQKEIETMAYFHDTLSRSHPEVVMVTIACDREFQKMYHFLKNSKRGAHCHWTWLHFDSNYDLLRRFGVVSYPYFVLLTPEGYPYYDYAPAPGSGIFLRGPWEKPVVDENSGKEYKF